MNGIKLISTGSAVPKKVVTNDDLAKIVDTNDEWISTRTGIRSRRYCTDGESHTSLCLAAARQALERGGVAPGEIGVCLDVYKRQLLSGGAGRPDRPRHRHCPL